MQDTFGMEDDAVLKAASGFSGGIGGMHDTCGGLTGAVMMLGSVYGRGRDDLKSRDKIIATGTEAGKVYKWFEKEFGSTKCYDICKNFAGGTFYDIHVPWQAELAEQAGVREKCAELVEATVSKAAEMLCDGPEPEKKPEEKK